MRAATDLLQEGAEVFADGGAISDELVDDLAAGGAGTADGASVSDNVVDAAGGFSAEATALGASGLGATHVWQN